MAEARRDNSSRGVTLLITPKEAEAIATAALFTRGEPPFDAIDVDPDRSRALLRVVRALQAIGIRGEWIF